MNLWIVTLIIGLLVVTTVVVIGITTVNAENPEEPSYTDCQGTCGPGRNCGLATCGVVSGTGGCGCGG
jgi:hypothetical protein